jgi:hypothetical protein
MRSVGGGRRLLGRFLLRQPFEPAAGLSDLLANVLALFIGQRLGTRIPGSVIENGEDISVDEISDSGRGQEVRREAVIGRPPIIGCGRAHQELPPDVITRMR